MRTRLANLFHVFRVGALALAVAACAAPAPTPADNARRQPGEAMHAGSDSKSDAAWMPGGAARDSAADQPTTPGDQTTMTSKVEKTDAEWKQELTPEQYRILRQKGTERAFTGKYWDSKTPGVYACAACGHPLFDSTTKYESGTGWPSFYKPISDKAVDEESDRALGMERTEVLCSRCGGHLGHVFPDGPPPTGLRYCLNSAALSLEPREDQTK